MFQALFNISTAPFYLRNSTPEVRMHLFTTNSSINILAHFFGYMLGGYLPEIVRSLNPELSRIEVYRYAMVGALSLVFISNIMFMQIKRVPIPKVRKRIFDGLKEKEWKILGRLILPKLCFAFGGGLIIPFMNLYLKEKFDLSTKMIGVSYALLQLFIFLGIFITPALVKKSTNLKFIVVTSALSIPFMLMMGLTGSVGLVLGCFFLRGMLMNMSSPITSMFEMEHVREKECVFASAVIMFSYHLVYTFSTRLGGQLIESYSFGPTFYVAAFFYGLAGVLYYKFFRQEEQTKVIEFKPVIESEAA
jgi:predicted MFS family arabinose efflux permease